MRLERESNHQDKLQEIYKYLKNKQATIEWQLNIIEEMKEEIWRFQ